MPRLACVLCGTVYAAHSKRVTRCPACVAKHLLTEAVCCPRCGGVRDHPRWVRCGGCRDAGRDETRAKRVQRRPETGLPNGVDSPEAIERKFQAALADIKAKRQFSVTAEGARAQGCKWTDLVGWGDDW